MPSMEKRQRQGKEREIMERVKKSFLYSFPLPKKRKFLSATNKIYRKALLMSTVITNHPTRIFPESFLNDTIITGTITLIPTRFPDDDRFY